MQTSVAFFFIGSQVILMCMASQPWLHIRISWGACKCPTLRNFDLIWSGIGSKKLPRRFQHTASESLCSRMSVQLTEGAATLETSKVSGSKNT